MSKRLKKWCRDCRDLFESFLDPRGKGMSNLCPDCVLPMDHPQKTNSGKICSALRMYGPLTVEILSKRTRLNKRKVAGTLNRIKRKAVKKGPDGTWMLKRQSYKGKQTTIKHT